MVSIVDQAMKEGALGLSSGLFYVPGSFSTKKRSSRIDESCIKIWRYLYFSRICEMRQHFIIESVNETIDIGKLAKLPAVITHHKVIGKKQLGAF